MRVRGSTGTTYSRAWPGTPRPWPASSKASSSGRVRKADGSRYKQPKMSRQFTKITRSSGLPALAAELDRKLVPALHVVKVDHPLFGPYSVADAFADSLRMADRLGRPGEAPVQGAILAVEAAVQVRVGGWVLPAVADMLVIDDPECDAALGVRGGA